VKRARRFERERALVVELAAAGACVASLCRRWLCFVRFLGTIMNAARREHALVDMHDELVAVRGRARLLDAGAQELLRERA
jgi:hypothetical protein